jgi:hypothetical protein
LRRVTLDSNAIIDVEENRPAAAAVRELIALHRAARITLCVSNIVAGERDRDGLVVPDYRKFTAKLGATDLSGAELLNPLAHWGITFVDQCIWPEPKDTLRETIHHVLFPNSPDYFAAIGGESDTDRAKRTAKGNNQLCDVLGMWCHIRYRGDVFVTSDENFLKSKRDGIIALGAGTILRPHDAIGFIRNTPAI